ncbi:MAG: cell wall-binding repeat-containing protein, partial [Microbacteriaceae bacterium]
TGISFGMNLISTGTLTTDDYAVYNTVGAPPVTGTTPVLTSRVAGQSLYDTAIEVSRAFTPGVSRAYVAFGGNFPDALGASAAAAHFGAPLLLTPTDSLANGLAAELTRLNPTQIVVVGGNLVVSNAVFAQLQAIAPTTRVAGNDLYATSRAIALDAFGTGGATTAYLATGAGFADASAAAPAAAHFNAPVIVVRGTDSNIDAATGATLTTLGVTTVKIAGGNIVMSTAMENALRTRPGTTVQRHWGQSQYDTAAAINLDAFATSATVHLAVGTNFPDALVGSALAASRNAPLYLTPTACLEQGARAGITRLGATQVVLVGGPLVLSAAVANLTPCS